MTSDTSLFIWGTHLQTHMTHCRWTQVELTNNINWLELRVVHLALCHFQSLIHGQHKLILTNNVATKAHIDKEGPTCRP